MGHRIEVLEAAKACEEPDRLARLQALVYPLQDDDGGMRLLGELRRAAPAVPILAILPREDKSVAAEALLAGADETVARPVGRKQLEIALRDLRRKERTALRLELKRRYGHLKLISLSPRMRQVYEQVLQVALTRSTVLIRGESGTGKELIARAIHFNSPRRDGPFIAVNCGAIPETIIESELFGHQRGAFTGAVESTRGKFEQADRGTLYLDEIGDMSPATQVKLLRALEEGEVTRVGGQRPVRVDIRVVTATNADLENLVADGRFREDLYFRVNVVPLDLPPLRDRREDIPFLTRVFLREACEINNLPPKELAPEVVELFLSYAWPGNVRELKNLMEGLSVMTPSRTIQASDLPAHIGRSAPAGTQAEVIPLAERFNLKAIEKKTIQAALAEAGGSRKVAAELLGISERTLYRKLPEAEGPAE
jgi:DNA-binding NtrC family response regulator